MWLPWGRLISKACIRIYLFAISAAGLSKRKLLNSDTDMSCADKPTVGGFPPIIPFRLEVSIIVTLLLPIKLCFCQSSQVKTALCRSVRCYLGTSILWWIRGCCIKAVRSEADDAGVGEAFGALRDQTELLLLLKLLNIPSVVFDSCKCTQLQDREYWHVRCDKRGVTRVVVFAWLQWLGLLGDNWESNTLGPVMRNLFP